MIIGTKFKNALQVIYENTSNEIIDDIKQQLSNSDIESIFKLNPQRTVVKTINNDIMQSLITEYHSSSLQWSPEQMHLKNNDKTIYISKEIKKYISISMIDFKDENISYYDAVEYSINIIKNINLNDLYGVLFTISDEDVDMKFINPFHPVIAERFIRSSDDFENIKISNISFFTYKDEKQNITDEEKENAVINIAKIIKLIQDTNGSSIIYKDVSVKESKYSHIDYIEYRKFIKKQNGEYEEILTDNEFYIVPCQILNDGGIALPYYGSVAVTNGAAYNISPMFSANINSPISKQNGEIEPSRICTNSGKSFTIEGMSALNHSNLTSPLNRNSIKKGSLAYVEMSIEFSIGLYNELIENNQSTYMTFNKFKILNKNSASTEYFSYLKEYYETHAQNEQQEENYDETTEPTAA